MWNDWDGGGDGEGGDSGDSCSGENCETGAWYGLLILVKFSIF